MVALLLANDGFHHHGHPWIGLFFLLAWVLIIGALIWRFGRRGGPWRPSGESILAERFAHGEIDAEEYRSRRAILRRPGQ